MTIECLVANYLNLQNARKSLWTKPTIAYVKNKQIKYDVGNDFSVLDEVETTVGKHRFFPKKKGGQPKLPPLNMISNRDNHNYFCFLNRYDIYYQ